MRFTEADKAIIFRHIENNSSNLRKAFENAVAEIGHGTVSGAQALYYRELKFARGRAFATKSDGKILTNVKNAVRFNPTKKLAGYTQLLSKAQAKKTTEHNAAYQATLRRSIHALSSML